MPIRRTRRRSFERPRQIEATLSSKPPLADKIAKSTESEVLPSCHKREISFCADASGPAISTTLSVITSGSASDRIYASISPPFAHVKSPRRDTVDAPDPLHRHFYAHAQLRVQNQASQNTRRILHKAVLFQKRARHTKHLSCKNGIAGHGPARGKQRTVVHVR